jgi:hypothetical protein
VRVVLEVDSSQDVSLARLPLLPKDTAKNSRFITPLAWQSVSPGLFLAERMRSLILEEKKDEIK